MELLRRLSALLIALSLALPERSCVNDGVEQIHYPLSDADSLLAVVIIAALYTLPLLLLLLPRFRKATLLAGIVTVAAGMYFVTWGATIASTKLLIGWYTYTTGAVIYLAVCAWLLLREILPVAQSAPPPS